MSDSDYPSGNRRSDRASGVFLPYSNSKTSILILDKKLNKEIKDIFFTEINNDGYSLNVQRNEIEGSEIEGRLKMIIDFLQKKKANKSI